MCSPSLRKIYSQGKIKELIIIKLIQATIRTEGATRGVLKKILFLKFSKIHRKTLVPESFLIKLQALALEHLFYKTPPYDYFCIKIVDILVRLVRQFYLNLC